ncbi:MAG TPA: hypothetical protein PKN32_10610 [Bacteroidales bacterium]|nr:hypothetical protein [Bacteroidales bacterium]
MKPREIKSLSKEDRQELAKAIRQDPELFNAINGIGGLSLNSPFGLLQGTITKFGVPVTNAMIYIKLSAEQEIKAFTNQYGYYKMTLQDGAYSVKVIYQGDSTSVEVKINKGRTTSFDFDFYKEKLDIVIESETSSTEQEIISE